MRDLLDLHTHTIASGHAYNTINEMIQAAVGRGLKVLGITEHGPAMAGTCNNIYFQNLKVLPRERSGIRVLYGVELNILDFEGHVDLPEHILEELDVVIASMHLPCFTGGTKAENTRAYLNVMKNPHVKIIGHPDDGRYPMDYKALVEGAKEHGVLLEMNNSSLSPSSYRTRARENYMELLEYCKEFDTPIVVDSDAHVDLDVGNHRLALELIEAVDFPERLVLNANPDQLEKYFTLRL